MSETLPLFPLTTVLFPGMRLPLHIFEQRYRQLARDLLDQPEPRRFGVIAIRKGQETGGPEAVAALHEIGCVATVRQLEPLDDGRYDLVAVGAQRFRLLGQDRSRPYLQGEIEPLPETISGAQSGGARPGGAQSGGAQVAALAAQQVQAAFRGYLNALADRGGAVITVADLPDEPLLLSYVVGAAMIIDLPERQSLLAAPDALTRLRAERSLLVREIGMLRATTSRPAPDLGQQRYSPN
jgi:Lon protease-like protein